MSRQEQVDKLQGIVNSLGKSNKKIEGSEDSGDETQRTTAPAEASVPPKAQETEHSSDSDYTQMLDIALQLEISAANVSQIGKVLIEITNSTEYQQNPASFAAVKDLAQKYIFALGQLLRERLEGGSLSDEEVTQIKQVAEIIAGQNDNVLTNNFNIIKPALKVAFQIDLDAQEAPIQEVQKPAASATPPKETSSGSAKSAAKQNEKQQEPAPAPTTTEATDSKENYTKITVGAYVIDTISSTLELKKNPGESGYTVSFDDFNRLAKPALVDKTHSQDIDDALEKIQAAVNKKEDKVKRPISIDLVDQKVTLTFSIKSLATVYEAVNPGIVEDIIRESSANQNIEQISRFDAQKDSKEITINNKTFPVAIVEAALQTALDEAQNNTGQNADLSRSTATRLIITLQNNQGESKYQLDGNKVNLLQNKIKEAKGEEASKPPERTTYKEAPTAVRNNHILTVTSTDGTEHKFNLDNNTNQNALNKEFVARDVQEQVQLVDLGGKPVSLRYPENKSYIDALSKAAKEYYKELAQTIKVTDNTVQIEGVTYDRAQVEEALRTHQFDPNALGQTLQIGRSNINLMNGEYSYLGKLLQGEKPFGQSTVSPTEASRTSSGGRENPLIEDLKRNKITLGNLRNNNIILTINGTQHNFDLNLKGNNQAINREHSQGDSITLQDSDKKEIEITGAQAESLRKIFNNSELWFFSLDQEAVNNVFAELQSEISPEAAQEIKTELQRLNLIDDENANTRSEIFTLDESTIHTIILSKVNNSREILEKFIQAIAKHGSKEALYVDKVKGIEQKHDPQQAGTFLSRALRKLRSFFSSGERYSLTKDDSEFNRLIDGDDSGISIESTATGGVNELIDPNTGNESKGLSRLGILLKRLSGDFMAGYTPQSRQERAPVTQASAPEAPNQLTFDELQSRIANLDIDGIATKIKGLSSLNRITLSKVAVIINNAPQFNSENELKAHLVEEIAKLRGFNQANATALTADILAKFKEPQPAVQEQVDSSIIYAENKYKYVKSGFVRQPTRRLDSLEEIDTTYESSLSEEDLRSPELYALKAAIADNQLNDFFNNDDSERKDFYDEVLTQRHSSRNEWNEIIFDVLAQHYSENISQLMDRYNYYIDNFTK